MKKDPTTAPTTSNIKNAASTTGAPVRQDAIPPDRDLAEGTDLNRSSAVAPRKTPSSAAASTL
jgi:hypothetical protein